MVLGELEVGAGVLDSVPDATDVVAKVVKAQSAAFWNDWYPAHKDDKVGPEIHVLFFHKQASVHDFKAVFEWVFGPAPVGV